MTSHCIFFHIWHHTTVTQHIAYDILHHNPHHRISHRIQTFYILHYATFHTTPYSTSHWFCGISIAPCLVTFHISRTTFHVHHNSNHSTASLHTTPHHAHIPPRITSCTSHSNINCTSHWPSHSTFETKSHVPHCISTRVIPHNTTMSNMASNRAIPHYSARPHQFHILHQAAHTIFPMYDTIISHRITTFYNVWHCTTPRLASHVFYIAPYSTSQPH